VIGNGAVEFRSIAENIPAGKNVVDLVRITDRRSLDEDGYDGICW
jgi:hypothetical protein